LFSIWQERMPGARFLDLFCGSGAAGLEALSRGAGSAVLVDADGKALAVAARNRDRLQAQVCRTVRAALPAGLASALLGEESFDLIFADPPYAFEHWQELLEAVEARLADSGEAVIEHTARAELPGRVSSIERIETRRYGETALSFYRRSGPARD
jgi:16S rRNA (guanine(966)-N(2))-methyltransferase RsmD